VDRPQLSPGPSHYFGLSALIWIVRIDEASPPFEVWVARLHEVYRPKCGKHGSTRPFHILCRSRAQPSSWRPVSQLRVQAAKDSY
jgi:hypothetical protein